MAVPWYVIVALICAIIAPFDALYMYIKNEKRKDALRRKREADRERDSNENRGGENRP